MAFRSFSYSSLVLILLGLCACSLDLGFDNENSSYSDIPFDQNFHSDSTRIKYLENGLTVHQLNDSLYLFEDDLLFDEESLIRLSKLSVGPSPRATITNSVTLYWPGGRVPYSFDSSFSLSGRDSVLTAMNIISSNSGVSFVPATTTDYSRVVFYPSSYFNASQVGRQQQPQYIYLADYSVGHVIHELMHTLGFYHEHSRADRDDYIQVVSWNIKPDYLSDFSIHSDGMSIGSFDFGSVMLYSSYSINPNVVYNTSYPMLLKLDGTSFIGQRDSLSTSDISGIQNIYGPPYHKMIVTRDVIQDYYEPYTEIYEEEMTVTLKFYSDRSLTTLQTLNFPMKIVFRVITTTCDSNHQLHSETTYPVVTIPAGVDTYTVCTRYNYYREEWGMPYYYDFAEYCLDY